MTNEKKTDWAFVKLTTFPSRSVVQRTPAIGECKSNRKRRQQLIQRFLKENKVYQNKKYVRPKFNEAIRAMCFECMGDFIDGRKDCRTTNCPLYAFQPYRKLEPDFTWITAGAQNKGNRRFIPSEMSVSGEDENYHNVEEDKE